jgi:hypothetical protein
MAKSAKNSARNAKPASDRSEETALRGDVKPPLEMAGPAPAISLGAEISARRQDLALAEIP